MKTIIFFVLLLSSVFGEYSSIQDIFQNAQCSYEQYEQMATVNLELAREWNCHLPSNMRYMGDLPHLDFDPRANKYIQAPFYWVLKEALKIIFEETNLFTYLQPGFTPRYYVYRAYQPLSSTLQSQYNYDMSKCGVNINSVAESYVSMWASGTAISVLPTNPLQFDISTNQEWTYWKDMNTFPPTDRAVSLTMTKEQAAARFKFFWVGTGVATYDGPAYFTAGNNAGKLVLLNLQGTYGYQSFTQLLNNVLMALGVKVYVGRNMYENPYYAGESGLYPTNVFLPIHCCKQQRPTLPYYCGPNSGSTWYTACKGNSTYNLDAVTTYAYVGNEVPVSINVQAFKHYWNAEHPTDLIADPDTNTLTEAAQLKLLTQVPPTGLGAASCDPRCNTKQRLDLVFILDGSGSVMRYNFKKELQFVIDVTAQLPVAQDSVRVGVIVFSRSVASPVLNLNHFADHAQIAAEVPTLPYPGSLTWTGLAFKEARNMLTDPARGARGADVPKLIVIVTDGLSNQPYNQSYVEAKINHEQGFNVVAIGVGSFGYSVKELNFFATDPNEEHVYALTNFELTAITKNIQRTSCGVPANIYAQDIAFNSTTWTNALSKFNFYTHDDAYMLCLNTAEGTVFAVYQYYYGTTPVNDISEYSYDIAINCTTRCCVEVPGIYRKVRPARDNLYVPPKRETVVPGVQVPLAIKFFGATSGQEVKYTMTSQPYNEEQIATPTVYPQVVTLDITEEQVKKTNEDFHTFTGIPTPVDDGFVDEDTPDKETKVDTNAGSNGNNNAGAIWGGSLAAVFVFAGIVGVVVIKKRAATESAITPVMPSATNGTFTTMQGQVLPVQSSPRQSAVKRLNSVQYLNDMLEPE